MARGNWATARARLSPRAYFQRAFAAVLAISFRRLADIPSARAFPPLRPSATAAGSLPSSGVLRMTWTVLRITSAGGARLWDLGAYSLPLCTADGRSGARWQGAAMSPMKQQIENPRCSACGDEMELTVLIPPFGSPHGLKVFTCPKCGRSEDYLVTSPSQAA